MKLLGFTAVSALFAVMAFGMWQYEQSLIDQDLYEVEYEMALIACSEDRRAVRNIKFDYDMRTTCVKILKGEEVL